MAANRRQQRMRAKRRRFLCFVIVAVLAVIGIRGLVPFPYTNLILAEAQRYRVNPYLVAAIVRVESSYRPAVVSARGAVGLMQIMPSTAHWIRAQKGLDVQAVSGPLTDPRTNIALGTWYVAYLFHRYHGNLMLTLASYNSGPSVVGRWLRQGVISSKSQNFGAIPYPETLHFVRRVLFFRSAYRWVYGFWGIVHNAKGGWKYG